MAIRKRTGSVLVLGAVTAAMIGMAAAPAVGATATTWTVKPGGAITAKAGVTKLKDTKTGSVLQCMTSSGKGTAKKGSGLPGAGIASITALGFTSCTGPLSLTFTVKTTGFPWKLNAASFKSGVTTGTITGIRAKLTGPSCSATVGGTSASAAGTVAATYTNSTGKLTTKTTGGNLHVFNVVGCAGLINSGDPTTFSGSYAISPKQTITSP
jgi:hypothetical protein